MIRQALRSLLRAPAFSATVVLTVALGMGVNTAIFCVVYSVLLDPLPYRDPGRLVHIAETHPEFPSFQVAAPDYFDWRRTSHSFADMAAHTFQAMGQTTLLGQGEPERVQVTIASHQLFPMLGIQPLHGRGFSAGEDAGQLPVALLNESLWRRKFSADPSVIGHTLRLGNFAFTVVGIVPGRQAYPTWADVWIPLSFLEPQLKDIRRFHPLEVIARLKPGVTVEQAQAEMQTIASSLAATYPETNNTVGAAVFPLSSIITGEIRPALLISWAAVSLVLLLACANVAHLVLIRSVSRSREMAVRAALGASTFQLMRVPLTENVMLALAGGALGVFFAALSLPLLGEFAAGAIPRLNSLALTPITLLFSATAAILCALLFALPAIFHARKMDIHQTIKQSAGLSASHRRSLFSATIVAAEIALAFVVIAAAGLLYRSFAALLKEDAGFDARGVLAVDVALAENWDRSASLFEQQLAPRIRGIPGVTSVAAANCAPMTLGSTELSRYASRFGVAGRTFEPGKFPVAQLRWITPDYFRTLGIPLKRGRLFSGSDAGKPGYIVNETLARRFFPGQDPVGKEILMGVVGPQPEAGPIIGVAGDVRDLGLDLEPRPTLYQLAVSPRMTLLIRAGVSPSSFIPAVRHAIRAVDAEAPITRAVPLLTILEASMARRRFVLYLLSAFAVLAAALTAIGVYGVITYSVSRRAREFAIRFALGARRSHLRSLIVRNFALPAAAGLIGGAWLAYLFAQTMRTQLYKLSPFDPPVLAGAILALLLLVVASALRPVGKASSVSETTALRE
jgi:predicted permease